MFGHVAGQAIYILLYWVWFCSFQVNIRNKLDRNRIRFLRMNHGQFISRLGLSCSVKGVVFEYFHLNSIFMGSNQHCGDSHNIHQKSVFFRLHSIRKVSKTIFDPKSNGIICHSFHQSMLTKVKKGCLQIQISYFFALWTRDC